MPNPRNSKVVVHEARTSKTVVTMRDLAKRKDELRAKQAALRNARGTKASDRI